MPNFFGCLGLRRQSRVWTPESRLFMRVEGFILAGGASSRMGRDKAALRLGEETLVARVASALTGIATRVSVVSSRHAADSFGLPVVRGVFEGAGAVGGPH